MIVCDVDYTFFSAVTIFRAVNHRVNPLAHSDAGTFRSVAHVRGNNSSRNVEPCHTLLIKIGNVNAATSFFRIIASNLAIRNGDTGAVFGSKAAAAVVTISILAAEFSHSIVGDITARNGHDAAYGHNAATIARLIAFPIERRIARNYRIFRNRYARAVRVHTAAIGSVVACDHATGQIKGRTFIFEFDACALAPRGCTANVATAHIDGGAVLGIDEAADIAVLFLRKRTAPKVKLAVLVDVNEPQRGTLGRS